MSEKKTTLITVDDVEYNLEDMSDEQKDICPSLCKP